MKNPTDFGKGVETDLDPYLPNYPLGESPTTGHCQVESITLVTSDCESRTFLL